MVIYAENGSIGAGVGPLVAPGMKTFVIANAS